MNFQHQLTQAKKLPDFPAYYEPQMIEFFDQEGLLGGQTPLGDYEQFRPHGYQAEYIAVYVDGELGFFLENGNVLLNRIKHMAVFNQFTITRGA